MRFAVCIWKLSSHPILWDTSWTASVLPSVRSVNYVSRTRPSRKTQFYNLSNWTERRIFLYLVRYGTCRWWKPNRIQVDNCGPENISGWWKESKSSVTVLFYWRQKNCWKKSFKTYRNLRKKTDDDGGGQFVSPARISIFIPTAIVW